MSTILPLIVVVPILGAALSVAVHRSLLWQRVVGLVSLSTVTAISVALLLSVDRSGAIGAQLGGWIQPVGVSLSVDRLSALLLLISSSIVLAVFVYSISQLGAGVLGWWFHPKYLTLVAGVALALTTADLFTLFVGFEVLLMASYTLLTVRSERQQVRSTMTYVVVNLLASILFLSVIAVAYSSTGTLDFSDMAKRLDGIDPALSSLLSVMTLVVFGIKAALFPLFMWLPDSYPTAPAPVTALFAGLLTKVGIYAIYRTQGLFGVDSRQLLLFLAGATMLFGVLGAVAQRDVKRILSFHIVSQIGYMLMGLGLLSTIGVAAGIAYIFNQILVKTGLFLVAGEIETEHGGSALDAGGGLASRRPGLAIGFGVLALSLAGVPPFGGFVLKYALIREGILLGHGLVVAIAIAVSLLTLFSMLKIWSGVFWGGPEVRAGRSRPGMRAMTAGVALASLAVAVWAEPLMQYALDATGDLAVFQPGSG